MAKFRQFINVSYCRYYSVQQAKKKIPIISCKRPEFNHYEGQTYGKFEVIKLASQGWSHVKSKNDYFTIFGDAPRQEEETLFRKSFPEIGLTEELCDVVSQLGYSLPTVIQAKSFLPIIQGYNTAITAETGCGKTLAYLLPIIQHITSWKPHIQEDFNSPLAVVLTPSRELASQLAEVAQSLSENLNINVSTLIGGKTKKKIMDPPVEYTDLMIATLGAFSKLVTTGIIKLHNVHHIVLDEADTLLDDSFIDKLSALLKKFRIHYKCDIKIPPEGCQITLVSATLPHELPETVSAFMDPQSLRTVTTDKIHRILPHIPHKFVRLGKAQKPGELLRLVQADLNKNRQVMVFSNKTSTCDFVSMFLNENSIKCLNMNGRMAVPLKAGNIDKFKSGEVKVISSTDVTSRGIDTKGVSHIINYDFPLYTSDYIHRCGRTGRIGSPQDCFVTNFIAWPREIHLVQKIEEAVRRNKELPNVNANIRRQIVDRIVKMSGLP
ncbi:unnamed protein product [Leptosia nina]|uniref:RNA helicase n=1 Tax=Leptosia nina TaxID=320188 RepID=A0AAV1IXE6_9NEOP